MRKNQKGFSIVEVLIVLVIVGIIGLLGWRVYSSRKTQPNTTTKPATTDLEGLIKTTNQSVASKFPTISTKDDNPGYPPSINYTTPGYDFEAVVDTGTTYSMFYDKNAVPGNYPALPNGVQDAVISNLEAAGLMSVEKPKSTAHSTEGSHTKYYANADAVCELIGTFDGDPGEKPATRIVLVCARLSSFTAVAQKAQPFVKTYLEATKLKPEELHNIVIASTPKIATNKAGTYRYATMGLAISHSFGGTSYFYQKVGESTWHYYTDSQQGVGCGEKATEAAAAFADICRSGAP